MHQKKSGNSKFERHKCYIEKIVNANKAEVMETESATESDTTESIEPVLLDDQQAAILTKAFHEISKLHTTLSIEQIQKVLPNNWSPPYW